ncbi:MAG: hypothetical protein F6K41_30340 [Symploca sp. SIO3E6]|nr:hypothetical protein [Caldora sp. SIO3E6]
MNRRNNSPFPIPNSPFPIPNSPFPIPHSLVYREVEGVTGDLNLVHLPSIGKHSLCY